MIERGVPILEENGSSISYQFMLPCRKVAMPEYRGLSYYLRIECDEDAPYKEYLLQKVKKDDEFFYAVTLNLAVGQKYLWYVGVDGEVGEVVRMLDDRAPKTERNFGHTNSSFMRENELPCSIIDTRIQYEFE